MYQDREQYLRDHIVTIAEEMFPDDIGIEWLIHGFDHKKSLSYVEVEPVPNSDDCDRFKFAISFANPNSPETMAVHAREDGHYSLLSSTDSYIDPSPKAPAPGLARKITTPSPVAATTPASARPGIWFEGSLATLSTLVLAFILLTTWISPLSIDNGRWLGFAPGILVVEFLMIHSGIFMGVLPAVNLKGRWWLYAALLIFYSAFVWGVTSQFDNWYFLAAYSAVMFSRWLGAIKGDNNFNESIARSGASMFFLILVIFVMYAIPLPHLGITDEVFRQNSVWSQDATIEQSVYWLAACVTYFVLLAAFEWKYMKYRLRMAAQGPVKPRRVSMSKPARAS